MPDDRASSAGKRLPHDPDRRFDPFEPLSRMVTYLSASPPAVHPRPRLDMTDMHDDRPATARLTTDRPPTAPPATDRAAADRPITDPPATDRAAADRPITD